LAPILTVKNLDKTYESGFQALKDINLNIEKGEISRCWVPMAPERPHSSVSSAVSSTAPVAASPLMATTLCATIATHDPALGLFPRN